MVWYSMSNNIRDNGRDEPKDGRTSHLRASSGFERQSIIPRYAMFYKCILLAPDAQHSSLPFPSSFPRPVVIPRHCFSFHPTIASSTIRLGLPVACCFVF